MTGENDASTTLAIALLLEQMADSLEDLMPKVRALRSTASIIEAYVARNAGLGEPSQIEVSIAARLGLDRLEDARRRISDATYNLEDDLRRHGLLL